MVVLWFSMPQIRQFHLTSESPRASYDDPMLWQSAWNHWPQLSQAIPLCFHDTDRSQVPQLCEKEEEGDVIFCGIGWLLFVAELTSVGPGFGSGAYD